MGELPLRLFGCDIIEDPRIHGNVPTAIFVRASVEHLPFPDKSMDVVTCFHTLEHVGNLRAATEELIRVARRRLLIIVPRQGYARYTLDLHLHFWYSAEHLRGALGLVNAEGVVLGGDIALCVDMSDL